MATGLAESGGARAGRHSFLEDCSLVECVFLKLGGSLLTEKKRAASLRRAVARRLAREIMAALAERPLRLVLGHGAGSFGHFAAARHRTAEGLRGRGGWRGYAETRLAVIRLNVLLLEVWRKVGFYPLVVAPSSCFLRAADGRLLAHTDVLKEMLDAGQVPLVFGDAVLDRRQGFSIASTEEIFAALAGQLNPQRIILATDVDGVFARDPAQHPQAAHIPVVSAENEAVVLDATARCGRRDVTGGMAGKIRQLRRLAARSRPLGGMELRIISGLRPGAVYAALLGKYRGGTLIR